MRLSERIAHVLVIAASVLVIAASVLIVTGVLAAAFRAWFMTFILFVVGFVCIVASCGLMGVLCLMGTDDPPDDDVDTDE